jgi:MFS family permease
MKIISKIELLLIALWLGAACFFSMAVAPSVFSVLPSRELAGFVVNRTLTIINFSGLIISILLLLISFVPRGEAKQIWAWLQRVLLFIVALACGTGQVIIGFYLEFLRKSSETPISELAATDAIKMQFDKWHQYSVWVLVTGMIAALLVFFVMSRNKSSAGTGSKKKNDDIMPEFNLPDDLKF